MRENTARQRLAQRDTIGRQLLLDRINGLTSNSSACSRADTFAAYFNVSRAANATNAGRRRLLAAAADAGDSSSSWQGYYQMLSRQQAAAGINPRLARERSRFMGSRGNRVLAGMLLHSTRKSAPARCGSRYAALDFACRAGNGVVGLKDNATAAQYVAALLAAQADGGAPYGTDPVFLRSSLLYQPSLEDSLADYYNLSDRQQVSVTGAPYGFFPRQLPGYPVGFPVLLHNALPAARAAVLLQYLLDGNYLDGSTEVLTAELLAFNADLSVFGYAKAEFEWQADGSISGRLAFQGLPAMQYDGSAAGGAALFARELLPMWALALAFAGYVVVQTRRQLSQYQGQRSHVQVSWAGCLHSVPQGCCAYWQAGRRIHVLSHDACVWTTAPNSFPHCPPGSPARLLPHCPGVP
jgi:hypothetical protein